MTRVFISYRRDDSADITGRIFDRLRAHFDKQILFRDVDVIPFGSDFRQVIRKAVEDCQVLLAVIGPTWLSIASKTGTRRLDDPADFVRLEIETALKRDIPVIPVLVGKAAMPEAIHLPDSLQPLVFRHGLEVRRDPDFHRDVDTLIRGLNGLLNPTPPPAPPVPKAAPRRARTPKKAVVASSGPKAGDQTELVLPGWVKMVFVWCPPGTFLMGSEKGGDDEKPVHRVTLTKGFYMGVHPVTQAQWTPVTGATPSHFKGDNRPVEQVSWDDCQDYCQKLTAHLKGRVTVRLPSEAEWEYACRAETTTDYHTGEGEAALKQAGWYSANSDRQTHPVGELSANAWGLYDMHGNVWEWCQDWYNKYHAGDQVDPVHLAKKSDNYRILRGGSWLFIAKYCRAAFRIKNTPVYRGSGTGFRICFCLD
jgi:formylglycine-generating enzyme required for sulfatase activity